MGAQTWFMPRLHGVLGVHGQLTPSSPPLTHSVPQFPHQRAQEGWRQDVLQWSQGACCSHRTGRGLGGGRRCLGWSLLCQAPELSRSPSCYTHALPW